MKYLLLIMLMLPLHVFSQDAYQDTYEEETVAIEDTYEEELPAEEDTYEEELPTEEDAYQEELPAEEETAPLPIATTPAVLPEPASSLNSANQIATTSQQIPRLNTRRSILMLLNNTVWMTSDLKRNEDLVVFFKDETQGISLTTRGQKVQLPKKMYPIRIIENNTNNNSAILIIASQKNILYYSFKLLTSFYLLISPGFETLEEAKKVHEDEYFNQGYILQLIY
ncbi:MAG: hypothetical protein ACRCV0_02520 [Brevinema sp.]